MQMEYNSPFRSSVFKASVPKTVRQVYRERIARIYDEKDLDKSKLNHALVLLDQEYFGREQELYELIFNKYCSDKAEEKIEEEYIPSTYSAPLISELLLTENEEIECSECLQSFKLSEFPSDEMNHNGYFLACSRCAPDRNNVISVKWHPDYKSDAVTIDGDVAKIMQNNAHRYAVAAGRSITSGLHCWRWRLRLFQSWGLIGISHSKKFSDNSYGSQGVYGIAGSNQSYRNGQCAYDVQTASFFSGQNEVLVDMTLDLHKGELRFKIPGREAEAKMTGIPKNDMKGWVPHVNMHYAHCSVQIKKIPPNWFGIMPKRVKF